MKTLLLSLDGLLWLILMLVPLIFLQRQLHREIQAVFLILTRRQRLTQAIFALVFFPGILLHELSHFLMAKLLGVKTGVISLLPRPTNSGKLQMGYVEMERGSLTKDMLVGAAPLISGCFFIAMAAIYEMKLLPLWDFLRHGQYGLFWLGITILPSLHYFWLWFYLTFAISSMMMPSESDRHAWLPMGLIAGVLCGVILIAGAGPWMLKNLTPPLNSFLGALAAIFGLSASIHLVLILPFALFHRILSRLTWVDIQ